MKGRGKSGDNKKNWLKWKMRYAGGFRRHCRSGRKNRNIEETWGS